MKCWKCNKKAKYFSLGDVLKGKYRGKTGIWTACSFDHRIKTYEVGEGLWDFSGVVLNWLGIKIVEELFHWRVFERV